MRLGIPLLDFFGYDFSNLNSKKKSTQFHFNFHFLLLLVHFVWSFSVLDYPHMKEFTLAILICFGNNQPGKGNHNFWSSKSQFLEETKSKFECFGISTEDKFPLFETAEFVYLLGKPPLILELLEAVLKQGYFFQDGNELDMIPFNDFRKVFPLIYPNGLHQKVLIEPMVWNLLILWKN